MAAPSLQKNHHPACYKNEIVKIRGMYVDFDTSIRVEMASKSHFVSVSAGCRRGRYGGTGGGCPRIVSAHYFTSWPPSPMSST